MQKSKLIWFIVSLCALAYFATERLIWIWQFEYPPFDDSFFYLVEIQHRISYGRGYYTSFSPFLDALAFLTQVVSVSPEITFNALVTVGLVVISIATSLITWNKDTWWLLPSSLLIFFGTDLLFYKHIAYTQQGFALSLFFLGCALFLRGWRKFSVVMLILAASLHMFVAGTVALFLLFNGALFKSQKRYTSWSGLMLAVAALGYFWIKPRAVFELSSSFGWWATPEAFESPYREWLEFSLSVGMVIALSTSSFLWKKSDPLLWFCTALFVFLGLPIWDHKSYMAYRLAYVSLSFFFLGFLSYVRNSKHLAKQLLAACLATVFVIAIQQFPSNDYSRTVEMSPSTLKNNSQMLRNWIPKDSFVLAPHGIQYRITYFLERGSARRIDTRKDYRKYFVLEWVRKRKKRCLDVENVSSIPNLQTIKCMNLEKHWRISELSQEEVLIHKELREKIL